VGGQALADRYTYLPHIGLFIAIVWGVAELAGNARALLLAGAVAVLALSIPTPYPLPYLPHSRNPLAPPPEGNPHNSVANMCMGMWLTEQHRPDDALPYYLEAIRIDPASYEAQSNVGGLLCERGDFDEAVAHLREAVRLNPRFAQAYNNLANALARRG